MCSSSEQLAALNAGRARHQEMAFESFRLCSLSHGERGALERKFLLWLKADPPVLKKSRHNE
jgi:hypothetical protein